MSDDLANQLVGLNIEDVNHFIQQEGWIRRETAVWYAVDKIRSVFTYDYIYDEPNKVGYWFYSILWENNLCATTVWKLAYLYDLYNAYCGRCYDKEEWPDFVREMQDAFIILMEGFPGEFESDPVFSFSTLTMSVPNCYPAYPSFWDIIEDIDTENEEP